MSDTATLELLIQIREELAGLNRTRAGLQGAKKDAESFGALIKQGFGVGTGMDLARRAVDLLRNSLSASVGEAFRMAEAIADQAAALGITREAYQVVKLELAAASVEMSRFSMAVTSQTESLAAARDISSQAARAYRDLGLSAAEVEKLPVAERVLAVVRATDSATDKTRAFAAASQILGSRGLPQLLGGLRNLAEEGYDKVAAAARAAGRVMSDETVDRLDRAKQQLDYFKQATLPTATGTFLGWMQSAMETVGAKTGNFLNALQGRPSGDLGSLYVPTRTTPPPPAGPSIAAGDDVFGARIANAQAKASAIQNATMLNETQRRQALIPVLKEQEQLYTKLLESKYGDLGRDLPTKGDVSEEELSRYKERNELEWQLVQVRQARVAAADRPLNALMREMADTSSFVENVLANGIHEGLSSLGSDLWEAAKGTQSWGDAFRNLGDIAGRMLTQIITQMLLVQAINATLGIFGYGLSGNTGAGIVKLGTPTVAAAGGARFVTRGPTTLTVGDNPGGVEAVSVVPISGVGRTTVNGQSVHMAGGGTALVAGGNVGGGGDTFHFTYQFNGGVTREEVLGLVPSLIQATKGAVLEAQRRHREGHR